MAFRQVLVSSYIGFFVFIVLSLVFAKGGLLDSRDLSVYKNHLEKNIVELKDINQTLSLELKALSASPDTLKVYARAYGYFEKNESIVKIQGAPELKQYYKLGSLLKRNSEAPKSNPAFHITGIITAVLSFIVLSIRGRRRRYEKISIAVSP